MLMLMIVVVIVLRIVTALLVINSTNLARVDGWIVDIIRDGSQHVEAHWRARVVVEPGWRSSLESVLCSGA